MNYNSNMIKQFQNGRVTNIENVPYKNYNMFENNNNNDNSFKQVALKGIQEDTILNQVYFSKRNMDYIQNKIRHEVYIKSDKKAIIGRQSDIDLEIIMRAVFLQHSKNLKDHIKEQVRDLDRLVINECVEKIITEVNQYNTYINTVEHLPVPLDLPRNLSQAGTKNNRSVTTTF